MIYLLRHGQTEFNLEGRIQGQRDSVLTRVGERQAAAMGARLKRLVGDSTGWRMICSPLGRARASAEIVRAELGHSAPVEVEPRLAEVGLGSWEGLRGVDIDEMWPGARDGLSRWDWYFASPDGETYEALHTRVADWLAEAMKHERLIVVSHGVASRVLRGLYQGLPRETALRLEVPQDAFFHLAGGQVERIDCEHEDS